MIYEGTRWRHGKMISMPKPFIPPFYSVMFHTFVLWHIELVSGDNSIGEGMVSEQRDLCQFTIWMGRIGIIIIIPLHCMVVDSFHHHRWGREYQKADPSTSVWIRNTSLKYLRMPTLNIAPLDRSKCFLPTYFSSFSDCPTSSRSLQHLLVIITISSADISRGVHSHALNLIGPSSESGSHSIGGWEEMNDE